MGTKVIGLKVILEANTGTPESPTYEVVGGQKDASINMSGDMIDTSSKDGDGWKTAAVGLLGWDADFDGIIVTGDAAVAAIETAFRAGTALLVRMMFPDGSKRRGNAYVTSLPIKAPMSGEAAYSVKLQGDGELVLETGTITAPTITNPTQAEASVAVEDTFTTSAFAVVGGTDTQNGSQWQITETADTTFAAPVVNTISTVDKVALTLAAGVLDAATEYRLRVRHRGTTFGWSAWSTVHTFTTAS